MEEIWVILHNGQIVFPIFPDSCRLRGRIHNPAKDQKAHIIHQVILNFRIMFNGRKKFCQSQLLKNPVQEELGAVPGVGKGRRKDIRCRGEAMLLWDNGLGDVRL